MAHPPVPRPRRRSRSATRTPARLLDEGSRPDVPAIYRRHLRRSVRADIALTRLRILRLRIPAGDVTALPELRLCVAHPRAAEWEVEVHRALLDPSREKMVRRLVAGLTGGRISIRAAPLGGWSPDFTVFHAPEGPRRGVVGAHWLERPHPERGPILGIEVARAGARALSRRFDEIWSAAYDITPALIGLLGRAAARGTGGAERVETIDTPRDLRYTFGSRSTGSIPGSSVG